MKIKDIAEHNRVNMNRLAANDIDTLKFNLGIRCKNTPFLFAATRNSDNRYMIVFFHDDGFTTPIYFNNRNRLRRVVKKMQSRWSNITARLIVEVEHE